MMEGSNPIPELWSFTVTLAAMDMTAPTEISIPFEEMTIIIPSDTSMIGKTWSNRFLMVP